LARPSLDRRPDGQVFVRSMPTYFTGQPTRNASLHEEEPIERGRYLNEFILPNVKNIISKE